MMQPDFSGPVARVSRPMLRLIGYYQRWVSPFLPPHCRFYPTCSQYAADAIRQYGPGRGTWLALKRLGRCHPFCEGGCDPVPQPRDD